MTMSNRRRGNGDAFREGVPQTETDAAINAGEALAALKLTGTVLHAGEGGRPYRITEGDKVESMERYLAAPVSVRGDVEFYDAQSFVDYVNRFKDEWTLVFADKVARKFTSVLDYHRPTVPRWGRHRAGYQMRETRAFKLWLAAHNQPMTQAAFATFIEDNIPDIAKPDGATLVEIARTLSAKKDIQFESNILRQTDGSFKFFYAENVQGSTHRADLKIPDLFELSLAPFEGTNEMKLDARFRYRVGDGGKLSLWFELVRVEDVIETQFDGAQVAIKDGLYNTVLMLNAPTPARPTTE
jgi:uncharacterized protein YfdQ (DUF2303 family)